MHRTTTILGLLLTALAFAHPATAQIDLTAAYDGQLTVATPVFQIAQAAVALASSGKAVSGSIALGFTDATTGGVYNVVGTVRVGRTATRLRLKGSNGHGKLDFRGTVSAAFGIGGKCTIKPPGQPALRGNLAITRRAVTTGGDPTACDPVYQANQAFFDTQVMGTVLKPVCGQCHVAGGLAASTRLRVTATDALATSRTVAALVDLATPANSLILAKPSTAVPHGGGLQMPAGSAAYATMTQWVNLIAAAQCDVGGSTAPTCDSGSSGAQLWTTNCASCHGADARGLDGRPDVHCNRNIHDVVRNGRTGAIGTMPAFACLTDADIDALQAYVGGLCVDPTGQDLFTGNCQTCHGAGGVGQGTTPDLRCTVTSRLFNGVRTGRGPQHAAMPAFSSALLTDGEVFTIRAFLDTQCGGQPADYYRSNCATCHGATGRGGQNADGIFGPNATCQGLNDYVEKITQGSDGMPAFPEFSPPLIVDVRQYLLGFCGGN